MIAENMWYFWDFKWIYAIIISTNLRIIIYYIGIKLGTNQTDNVRRGTDLFLKNDKSLMDDFKWR